MRPAAPGRTVKYRHSYHAGNFADVHKHVTLLALLSALKRKDKGFAYLETHAGRGTYDVSGHTDEAAGGIGRFLATEGAKASGTHTAKSGSPSAFDELRAYSSLISGF